MGEKIDECMVESDNGIYTRDPNTYYN